MKKASRKRKTPKRVLRLPDLVYAKGAVLNTLGSPESKRAYGFAIDDFVAWYCSEPRLAFSKTVVMRYRLELESRRLAPATINLRLASVRRLAYEAADTGLLSPELAAGIGRVKGAKWIGVRLGNWLTVEQGRGHFSDNPTYRAESARIDGRTVGEGQRLSNRSSRIRLAGNARWMGRYPTGGVHHVVGKPLR